MMHTIHKSLTAKAIGITMFILMGYGIAQAQRYENVTMMAQGTKSQNSPSGFFIGQTGKPIGTCEVGGKEALVDFLLYASSAGQVSFYSPANTEGVAKNYRCDGLSWVPDVSKLKETRFRVLIPGSRAADKIYAQHKANAIQELTDKFFAGIASPNSSAVKYDPSAAPSSNTYDINTAWLIWVRIPDANGKITNGLIWVKEVKVAETPGLSTVMFDVLLQQ